MDLSIGIIACGRPEKVRQCIQGVKKSIGINYAQLLVVDSLISPEMEEYYRSEGVECIGFREPIGPSAARFQLIQRNKSELLLFLDDDVIPRPDSIRKLVDYAEANPEVGIVGAPWWEYDGFRAVGQRFHFGNSVQGDPVIFKSFLPMSTAVQLNLHSVAVDTTQASFVARRGVFARAAFDPQYGFFYELFDFFLQCKMAGIMVHVRTDAIMDHVPVPYPVTTMRQQSPPEDDRARFLAKWSLLPIGPLGMAIEKSTSPDTSGRRDTLAGRVLRRMGFRGRQAH